MVNFSPYGYASVVFPNWSFKSILLRSAWCSIIYIVKVLSIAMWKWRTFSWTNAETLKSSTLACRNGWHWDSAPRPFVEHCSVNRLNNEKIIRWPSCFLLDIAPEVLSVRPYDHRVDWWSLGILMYACLFGEYPVSATKDHVSMATKVLNHTFHLPSTILENKLQVKELLYHLLEKNPNQRLCSLDELRRSSFMSKLDFNHIYGKTYSPIAILMNMKSQWHDELGLHYHYQISSTVPGEEKHFYQNVDERRFQHFSEWTCRLLFSSSIVQIVFDGFYFLSILYLYRGETK